MENEGRKHKFEAQDAFWKSIIEKYETRNQELEREQIELQGRIDQMDAGMPAVMAFNMAKLAQGQPDADVGALVKVPCTCNQDVPTERLKIPDMSGVSVFSIEDADVHYMDRIKDLTDQEKKLIDEVNKLRSKEKALKDTKKKVEKLVCDERKNKLSVDGNDLQRMNERLLDENRLLNYEIADLKLEMKHIRETIEGPLARELDRERRRALKLESELKDKMCQENARMCTAQREVDFLRDQLKVADKNLKDMVEINNKLKVEMDIIEHRMNELQNDLINQKISEATCLAILKSQLAKPGECGGLGGPPHPPPPPPKKKGDDDDNDSRGGSCPCVKKPPCSKRGSLYEIARDLSNELKEAEQNKNIPDDLKDTVDQIKSLCDLIDQNICEGKEDKGDKDDEADKEDEVDKEDEADKECGSEVIVSIQELGITEDKSTVEEIGDVHEEVVEQATEEETEETPIEQTELNEIESEEPPQEENKPSEASPQPSQEELDQIPERESKELTPDEIPERESKEFPEKDDATKVDSEYVEEIETITELEGAHDDDIQVRKISDGINVTTTVTRSGILEIVTEGPAGVIETTLTLTGSGNVEVVTEFTECGESDALDKSKTGLGGSGKKFDPEDACKNCGFFQRDHAGVAEDKKEDSNSSFSKCSSEQVTQCSSGETGREEEISKGSSKCSAFIEEEESENVFIITEPEVIVEEVEEVENAMMTAESEIGGQGDVSSVRGVEVPEQHEEVVSAIDYEEDQVSTFTPEEDESVERSKLTESEASEGKGYVVSIAQRGDESQAAPPEIPEKFVSKESSVSKIVKSKESSVSKIVKSKESSVSKVEKMAVKESSVSKMEKVPIKESSVSQLEKEVRSKEILPSKKSSVSKIEAVTSKSKESFVYKPEKDKDLVTTIENIGVPPKESSVSKVETVSIKSKESSVSQLQPKESSVSKFEEAEVKPKYPTEDVKIEEVSVSKKESEVEAKVPSISEVAKVEEVTVELVEPSVTVTIEDELKSKESSVSKISEVIESPIVVVEEIREEEVPTDECKSESNVDECISEVDECASPKKSEDVTETVSVISVVIIEEVESVREITTEVKVSMDETLIKETTLEEEMSVKDEIVEDKVSTAAEDEWVDEEEEIVGFDSTSVDVVTVTEAEKQPSRALSIIQEEETDEEKTDLKQPDIVATVMVDAAVLTESRCDCIEVQTEREKAARRSTASLDISSLKQRVSETIVQSNIQVLDAIGEAQETLRLSLVESQKRLTETLRALSQQETIPEEVIEEEGDQEDTVLLDETTVITVPEEREEVKEEPSIPSEGGESVDFVVEAAEKTEVGEGHVSIGSQSVSEGVSVEVSTEGVQESTKESGKELEGGSDEEEEWHDADDSSVVSGKGDFEKKSLSSTSLPTQKTQISSTIDEASKSSSDLVGSRQKSTSRSDIGKSVSVTGGSKRSSRSTTCARKLSSKDIFELPPCDCGPHTNDCMCIDCISKPTKDDVSETISNLSKPCQCIGPCDCTCDLENKACVCEDVCICKTCPDKRKGPPTECTCKEGCHCEKCSFPKKKVEVTLPDCDCKECLCRDCKPIVPAEDLVCGCNVCDCEDCKFLREQLGDDFICDCEICDCEECLFLAKKEKTKAECEISKIKNIQNKQMLNTDKESTDKSIGLNKNNDIVEKAVSTEGKIVEEVEIEALKISQEVENVEDAGSTQVVDGLNALISTEEVKDSKSAHEVEASKSIQKEEKVVLEEPSKETLVEDFEDKEDILVERKSEKSMESPRKEVSKTSSEMKRSKKKREGKKAKRKSELECLCPKDMPCRNECQTSNIKIDDYVKTDMPELVCTCVDDGVVCNEICEGKDKNPITKKSSDTGSEYGRNVAELQELMEQIKCACQEAEVVAKPPLVKQASDITDTLSSLGVALEALQQKSETKDILIDALKEELRLRAKGVDFEKVIDDMFTNKENIDDYNRMALTEMLPRPAGKDLPKFGQFPLSCICNDKKLAEDVCECKVNPSPLEINDIRRIGPTSILIKWIPAKSDKVIGYEICVGDVVMSRVFSPRRTSAILDGVNAKDNIYISIYATCYTGRCKPPATAVYKM